MLSRMSEKITDVFVESKIILFEEKDIYKFGVKQGIMIVLNLFTLFVIGAIYKMIFDVLIYILAYIPLRSYAGGFHAKTHARCYLLSIIILNTVLLIIKKSLISVIACCFLTFFNGLLILFLAPVEDENKLLDDVETVTYRKKTLVILLLELLCLIVALCVKWFFIVYPVVLAITTLGFLLLIGKLKSKIYSCFS